MLAASNEPNLFTLTGKDTQITYSTSSFTGQPQFTYQDAQQQTTVTGQDIRTQQTEIGKLVTVTLAQVPDLETVTVSLLLPTIHLAESGEGGDPIPAYGQAAPQNTFATVAILTTHHTSIGGPRLVKGAVETYEVI